MKKRAAVVVLLLCWLIAGCLGGRFEVEYHNHTHHHYGQECETGSKTATGSPVTDGSGGAERTADDGGLVIVDEPAVQ